MRLTASATDGDHGNSSTLAHEALCLRPHELAAQATGVRLSPPLRLLGVCHAPGLWRDRSFLAALCGGIVIALVLAQTASMDSRRLAQGSILFLTGWLLVQPTLEELLYRGLLQGWLGEQRWSARRVLRSSAANWVTSLIFVAAHVPSQPALWAAGVLLPSLVFGHFRDRYGSLLPPVVLHLSYNAAFFLSPAAALRP